MQCIILVPANERRRKMFGKYFGNNNSGDLENDDMSIGKYPGLLYPQESESREV